MSTIEAERRHDGYALGRTPEEYGRLRGQARAWEAAALAAIDRDAIRFADRPVLWPLLIGAWKRKQA